MPASPDDDIFKRMFASFVARKTRNSASNVQPPQPPPNLSRPSLTRSNVPNGTVYADRPAADTLRKVATDYNGRGFNLTPSAHHQHHAHAHANAHHAQEISPGLRTGHQSHHHVTGHFSRSSAVRPDLAHTNSHHNYAANHGRQTAFPSLFHSRPSQDAHAHGSNHHGNVGTSSGPAPSRKHAATRSGGRGFSMVAGSKGSRGSKGSKGSEKQVSASTEDAPPRKRTRTHTLPTLQRSQSAHAGSLGSSRNSKGEKQRTNSRFNLPSLQPPPPSTIPPVIPVNGNNSSSGGPSSSQGHQQQKDKGSGKSFPCDKCPAVFAQKGQLSRHIRRVHEKLRPHACEYCGRLFGARSDRTRHVMVRVFFFCIALSYRALSAFSFFLFFGSQLTRSYFVCFYFFFCFRLCMWMHRLYTRKYGSSHATDVDFNFKQKLTWKLTSVRYTRANDHFAAINVDFHSVCVQTF